MKITLTFAFSGGHFQAECENFEEADKIIEYALKRGVINVTVPNSDGEAVTADVAAFEDAVELEKPPFDDQDAAGDVTPEVTPEDTDQVTDQVSVEDAQKAVKDYAAKHGIEAGRSLLSKFGFKRTNEITAEKAAEIVGACHE